MEWWTAERWSENLWSPRTNPIIFEYLFFKTDENGYMAVPVDYQIKFPPPDSNYNLIFSEIDGETQQLVSH